MDLRINKRYIFLIIIDLFLVASSYLMAIMLRFEFHPPAAQIDQYLRHLSALLIFSLVVFFAFGFYRRLWRYASIGDLNAIVIAITLSTAIIFFYTSALGTPFPRTIYIISWMLKAASIGGIRFFIRTIRINNHHHQEPSSRALIIGAGAAGIMVAKELHSHFNSSHVLPVGFIDDDSAKQRCSIQGIKVLGTATDIPSLTEKHKVDQVIIAIPSAPRSEIRRLTRLCSQLPVKIKILPGMYELINGKVSVSSIRPVQIEDLLGREEVKIDLKEISTYLQNQTVLVTGAGGSIGSELCRQVATFHPTKLLLLDHAENNVYEIELELKKTHPSTDLVPIVSDVRNREHINEIFQTHKPSVVFHAAAHKHVPLMEYNREEAIRNNVFGTKNVAEAADTHNANRFILISTDKAVNPTSIMGATKRVGEIVIQNLARRSKTHFCAVRFGNVLGSRGSVVPLFKKQIEEGGPVTITHPDMTRYFMTIREAVQLVIQAGAMGDGGEIFVLDMGEPVKILDLARDLIKLSGLEPDKDIKIAINGIRPGEKLFEEVLTSEEGTQTTKHERIFIAKATNLDRQAISQELNSLGQLLFYDMDLFYKQNLASLKILG